VAGQTIGQLHDVLTLGHCRDVRNLFVIHDEPSGKMARISPHVVGNDLDVEVADRHRAQQVGSEPREMRKSDLERRIFDGPAHERDRWTGMLLVGVPRAARQ
jgi:hypothetical protein